MSNPFKPTKRVIELLGFIDRGVLYGSRWSRKDGTWERSYRLGIPTYYTGIRNPTQKELLHLLTFDLAEEVRTPGNHDTFDTSDPKRPKLVAEGYKMKLKPIGKRLLAEAKDASPRR